MSIELSWTAHIADKTSGLLTRLPNRSVTYQYRHKAIKNRCLYATRPEKSYARNLNTMVGPRACMANSLGRP